MRIQNNITAMNTHRQYTINNENVAKNAEKLSSGYRINRAGDDAAGLAISEKMRSQIRGLNMATKNSQDAISLVQTAEGALQETHAMLQRMNELAVQSATGTNESLDRNALAKEFEQLKREINDVAEQTNFNNMTILDGSLSYEGYQRSAATAGVTKTVGTDLADAGSAASAGSLKELQSVKGKDGINPQMGEFTVDLAGAKFSKTSDTSGGTGTVKLDLEINGKKVSVTSGNITISNTADTSTGDIGSAFNGKTVEIDGVTYDITNTGDKLTFTASTDKNDGSSTILSGNVKVTGVTGTTTAAGSTYTAGSKDVAVTKEHQNTLAATTASSINQIDLSKVKEGDTITIGDKTYEFVKEGGDILDEDGNAFGNAQPAAGTKTENGNIAILWDGTSNDATLLTKLETAVNDSTNGSTGVTMTSTGAGVFTLEANNSGKVGNDAIKVAYNGASATGSTTSSAKTTVEFDFAKLKVGDKVTLSVGGQEISVEKTADDDRASFMKKLEDQVGATTEDGIEGAKVNGNAIVVNGGIEVSDIEFESGELQKTNGLRIQVGAEENQQLTLAIDAMNTKALGLDDATLFIQGGSTDESIDAAGRAITATRAAINKVSDQRATLGAMQNRLDHKIANLKVTSENLSAAESRIRDVDMAQEMTSFTKNNILSQAATAMLAQANALPQNVLSLLG